MWVYSPCSNHRLTGGYDFQKKVKARNLELKIDITTYSKLSQYTAKLMLVR